MLLNGNKHRSKTLTILFDHITIYSYYRKRKSICEKYRDLRKKLISGCLDRAHYLRSLRKLHHDAIELELDYFDILYLRGGVTSFS